MMRSFRTHCLVRSLISGLLILCWKNAVLAQEPGAGKQVEMSFTTKDSVKVPYLLYLPKEFEADKNVPLMLFLHGRGESDGPLSVVAKWGPPLLASKGDSFPFIIVSPQCPKEDNWSSSTQQARLKELLDFVESKYHADKSRIWLSGLSMGGSGSWRLSADQPNRFAAVVPICGRGDLKNVINYLKTPIWVFVGDQDGAFKNNVEIVDAIRAAGSTSIQITTLENIGHNSWSAAYASPDLYVWLSKHRLEK